MDKVIITKLGSESVKPVLKKSAKSFPKSILKKKLTLKGVRDPTKSPPLKTGMRKHTLRLLTDKGMRKRHKTQKHRISKMSSQKVSEVLKNSGLATNPKTPPGISRQILDNAVSAGFVSV